MDAKLLYAKQTGDSLSRLLHNGHKANVRMAENGETQHAVKFNKGKRKGIS